MSVVENSDPDRSSLVIWGIAIQNWVMAVILPLYLFVHLSTSPTVSSTDPAAFSIDLIDLASIPVSLVLGYILPSILMALPAPSVLSFDEKQVFMAIWQVFPLWTELLQQGTSLLLRKVSSGNRAGKHTAIADNPDIIWMGGIRALYVVLVFIAASTHIATMTLLATSKCFPRLFASEFAEIFSPSKVFWPVAMSSSTKMSSIGFGTLMLLQYDEMIGSLAITLWAVFMFASVMSQKHKFETAYIFIFDFVTFTALLGPIGYAVICIWARDELIFEDQKEQRSSRVEKKEIVKPSEVTKMSSEK